MYLYDRDNKCPCRVLLKLTRLGYRNYYIEYYVLYKNLCFKYIILSYSVVSSIKLITGRSKRAFSEHNYIICIKIKIYNINIIKILHYSCNTMPNMVWSTHMRINIEQYDQSYFGSAEGRITTMLRLLASSSQNFFVFCALFELRFFKGVLFKSNQIILRAMQTDTPNLVVASLFWSLNI